MKELIERALEALAAADRAERSPSPFGSTRATVLRAIARLYLVGALRSER